MKVLQRAETGQRDRLETSGVNSVILKDIVAWPDTITQFVVRIRRIG